MLRRGDDVVRAADAAERLLTPRDDLGQSLADDQDAVRRMLAFALKAVGVDTHLASDGHEAVQVFMQHRNNIGCAILDVNMPGLDGPDTFTMLRSLSPLLPIAFMTGDSSPYSLSDLLTMGPIEVFEKPLFVEEVVARLREVVQA